MENEDFGSLRRDLDQLATRVEGAAEASEATYEAAVRLADSLQVVASGLRTRDRALSVNSAVAYALFTILLGGAFFLVFRARVDSWTHELNRQSEVSRMAHARAVTAEVRLEAKRAAERAAHDYYRLLEREDHEQVVARAQQVLALDLTPTERAAFQAGRRRAVSALVADALRRGEDAISREKWADAESVLREGLARDTEGKKTAVLRYQLGRALAGMARFKDAVTEMSNAVHAGADSLVPEARFYLAEVLREVGDKARAREEYRRFARAHPKHPLSWKAKYWAGALAR